MIIILIFILLFVDVSLSDQNLTRNIGQDVTFSCIIENNIQLNEVSLFFLIMNSFIMVNRA